jgi:uncharacterized protein YndB with AHSA1/START domain
MEYGTIERSLYIEASPEVVYDVVSSPEHILNWFVQEAEYERTPASTGQLVFVIKGQRREIPMTVVEAVPGVRFSYRWLAPPAPDVPPVGSAFTAENSLLVTFDMTPQGSGTLLRVTEAGMRELGWEAAVLEEYYNDHADGWDRLMASLDTYVGKLTV